MFLCGYKYSIMKKYILSFSMLLAALAAQAQETPSTGLLYPRTTTAQRTAMPATTAKGIHVYDTDTNSDWYYNGTVWVQNASTAAGSKWTNGSGNVRLTNLSDGVTPRTPTNRFQVNDNGDVVTDGALYPTSGIIELGYGNIPGGNRTSFIDFHAQDGVDNNARIAREPGADGNLVIYNRGVGLTAINNTAGTITLDGTGKVGLGTYTPTANLQVESVGSANQRTLLVIEPNTWSNVANADASYLIRAGEGAKNSVNGGAFTVSGFGNGYFAGNLGIGNATPTAKLHVAGNAKIDGPNTLEFGAGTTKGTIYNGTIGYQTYSNGLDIVGAGTAADSSDRKITFHAQGGSHFLGSVGIGTAAPKAALDVAGLGGLLLSVGNIGSATNANLLPYANTLQLVQGWNRTGGNGEIDFMNSVGTGLQGGFNWSNLNNDGSTTSMASLNTSGFYVNSIYVNNIPAGASTDNIVTTDVNGRLRKVSMASVSATSDLRLVGSNHITQDAGIGSNGTSVGTGNNNVAIGSQTLLSNTTGYINIALGSNALRSNKTGFANKAIGVGALLNNTDGSGNLAVGNYSLDGNTTGSFNIAVGDNSGNSVTTGSNNLIIGVSSGQNITTGSNNTLLGNNITSTTNTSNNIIIADGAGNQRINVIASGNVGIGTNSPTANLQVESVGSPIQRTLLLLEPNTWSNGPNQVASYLIRAGEGVKTNGTAQGAFSVSGNGTGYFAGNVGIGIATPLSPLSIEKTVISNDASIIDWSTDSQLGYFIPKLTLGSNNPIAQLGDSGYIFSNDKNDSTNTGGFVIAPLSTTAGGIKIMENGNVGVGRITPVVKLDVNGYVRVGSSDAAGDATPQAGMIRYNATTGKFQGRTSTAWVDLN